VNNDTVLIKHYESFLPKVKQWIDATLIQYAPNIKRITDLNFPRLPKYFSTEILNMAKIVYVANPPRLPLSSMGLKEFQAFENMQVDGITYYDTFFVRALLRDVEHLHFHELVHVVQWKYLGADGFLLQYGLELLKNQYDNNFFEAMAYRLQSRFQNNNKPFDVEATVKLEIEKILNQ